MRLRSSQMAKTIHNEEKAALHSIVKFESCDIVKLNLIHFCQIKCTEVRLQCTELFEIHTVWIKPIFNQKQPL